MKVRVRAGDIHLTDLRTRMPFRYGIATMTRSPHAFVRLHVEIDRIVFLGAAPNLSAEKLKSRSLFIVARDDANAAGPRLPAIRAQYEKAPQPKELRVLDGSAHAQFLFQTDQGARVMREILRFLSAP